MSDKPKLEIKFSDVFVNLVCDRAKDLIRDGKDEGLVKHDIFGNLSLFLNKEPRRILFIIPQDNLPEELKGQVIYIGG